MRGRWRRIWDDEVKSTGKSEKFNWLEEKEFEGPEEKGGLPRPNFFFFFDFSDF